MKVRLAFALMIAATPVLAQQQSSQPTATQILGQQLGACAASQAELVERLGKLQAELDALKKEPPKSTTAPQSPH